MKREDFLRLVPFAGISPLILPYSGMNGVGHTRMAEENPDSRDYWISVLLRIANPVLQQLSAGTLKVSMPVASGGTDRDKFTHLEAFGRTLAGIAPWLELGPDQTREGELRAFYIDLTRQCLAVATDPSSPDFMNFAEGSQPLVDAAFLAHGLLRSFHQLWLPLDAPVKANVINAMKSTRSIRPGNNNWLLFSAMVEAFLLKSGHAWDNKPVGLALSKFSEWYRGDGVYGDGPDFHWDYYNSFVIHPILLDIVKTLNENGIGTAIPYADIINRARRYAVILERSISPEATYPPIGRSLCYRFGAFQLLGQIALLKQLPDSISPAQVRSALSAVIYRQIEASETFDEKGWLTIGFSGHQPGLGESYISTGSLYLCTTGLLPLGLPGDDPFWTLPSAEWTAKRLWKGMDMPADHAL